MIFDRQTLFSDAQAVTATAVSTNTIDLGPIATGRKRRVGLGEKIPVVIQVVEAFAGATSLTVSVQESDTESSGFADIATSVAVPVASLKPGYRFEIDVMPRNQSKRYIRLNYTVEGAATAGRVTAGVVLGDNSHG